MKTILMQYGFKTQESEKILYQLCDRGNNTFEMVSLGERLEDYFLYFKELGVKHDSEIRKVILRWPSILSRQPKLSSSRIDTYIALLNVSKKEMIKACLKQPALLGITPETVDKNVQKSACLLSVEKDLFIKACLKSPQLFYQLPSTINRNINQIVSMLNIEKTAFIKVALRQTSLFYSSAQTINQNVESSMQQLGIDKAKYIEAALKSPQLFYQSSETLNQNVEQSAALLGVKKEEFVAMALHLPTLFCLSPQTLYRKYKFLRRLYMQDVIRVKQNIQGSLATQDQLKTYLLKHPMILTYSMDNLVCKTITALYKNQKGGSKTPISLFMINNKVLYQLLGEVPDQIIKSRQVVRNFLKTQSQKHRV